MRYLLDVNVLVALGLVEHEFHSRVVLWIKGVASTERARFLTCSISELGFVRVLSQAPGYRLTVIQARKLLLALKKQSTVRFEFLPDDHDISFLPGWAISGRQTTDAHMLELARAHNAALATLDERIPSAYIVRA